IDVAIGVGNNEIEDVGLVLRKGQSYGIARGTAGISITTAGGGVVATPYRTIASTSGTPSAIGTNFRFEVSAEFEPWSLLDRVEALENADGAPLSLPDAFHLHLALGESHVAGRSAVLSPADLPAGAGYV